MEKMLFATLLVASLVMMSIVSAEPTQPQATSAQKALLAAGVADMKCRVTYDTGIMNAVIEKFPFLSSQLSLRIPVLQDDLTQMSKFADNGDMRGFHGYLQVNLTQHFKLDNAAVKTAIESLRTNNGGLDKNETKTRMREVKATNDALIETLNKCADTNKHVTLVIGYYTDSLTNYQKRADELAAKGIDTKDLNALITGARSTIVEPLKAATTGVTDGQQLKLAMDTYCLYDGCLNGTNFHFAAKFETARLTHLLTMIAKENMSSAMRTLLGDAENLLDIANTRITSWGTGDVQPADLQSAWGQITSAAKDLHEVFVTVKGEQNAPESG
ncbi:Uncharacterised protein [uncultured archaeon]|nr:Uncharacterised protein [uncultured archaeon]